MVFFFQVRETLPTTGPSIQAITLTLPPYFLHISISICGKCGGPVKVIACIEDPVVIKKILTHRQEKTSSAEFSPLPESRAPPPLSLFD